MSDSSRSIPVITGRPSDMGLILKLEGLISPPQRNRLFFQAFPISKRETISPAHDLFYASEYPSILTLYMYVLVYVWKMCAGTLHCCQTLNRNNS